MARRGAPAELHVGIDAEKVVVAAYPLRMRTGRAVRRRHGTTVELVPARPSGRSREDRLRSAGRVALPMIFLTAVLHALGITWWIPAVAGLTMVALVVRRQARAARTGVIALPPGDDAHVLIAHEERDAYARAVGLARRVRQTWPALGDLIDPAEADRDLTRALGELAALLARRQQIRRLRSELADVRQRDLPAGSPAVQALAAQRDRVEDLWRETGRTANRMLGSITAAAKAGESLIHEQRVHETARSAELAIARLADGGPAPLPEAGPELAGRTAAVIAAYRELAA